MREHRLIHRTLASLDEQRKAAGLAPLATPVGTSPRSAQANAQAQQQQYSQKLATAQAGSAQVKAATDANLAAKKTISDLSSLYENGTFTGTADQMAELNDAQGKLNYTNKTLEAQGRIAANAADTSGQTRLGEFQTVYQAAQNGNSVSRQNGQTYDMGSGEIDKAAMQRLIDSGMSPDQASKQLQDQRVKGAGTMSFTGQGAEYNSNGMVVPGSGRLPFATAKEKQSNAKYTDTSTLTPITNAGVTETPQEFEQRKAAVEQQNTEKMKQQQIAQEKGDQLKKFTAGIDTTQVDQTKTQIDTLLASVSNLSPDLQAAVLPSLISLQQSNNDITKEVNNIISSQPTDEEIQANYGSLEKYIKSEDAKYKALIERNMETAKEVATYNRDMLEAEKAIIEHDAAVAEQKQVIANAEGEKQLRRQLNRLGIQTDVQGLTYLQNEVQKGVDALENLKTANNLVSLKAQLAIGEGYRLEVKQAMETYEGNYLNITSQTTERLNAIKNSISTAKADRNKEIKEARKWGLEQKNANDRELRATISKANDTMAANLNMKRDDDRARETLGWNILNTAIDNYGSLVPKSIIDNVKSMLPPGTDIQDIINTPTIAERNSRRIGGGGGIGGITFSPSEMKSDGKPVSFDEFVKQRQAEIKLKPDLSLEDVKYATDMTKLRAEYDAKFSQHSQLDPNQIVLRLEDRTKNSAKNVRENAQATVQKYLQAGMYKEADLFVDGLGAPLSAAERGDMVQALNARKNVLRIQELLDEFGSQGPVTGRLKDANLWSTKQAELNGLVTQTVPGLARGIFKEVGVLTDQDIERYTKTIPNSKNTVEQSQALTKQLLDTINMSIENQLAVLRDSGLNTRDLRTRFETLDNGTPPSSTPLNPSQKAWLDSL